MFTKGKSGNPGGRPVENNEVKQLARANGVKAISRLVELIDSDDERVASGAAQAVLDRAFGKPTQSTEVTGPDGAPFRFEGLQITLVRPGE